MNVGLIGFPVEHSLSPAMHGAAFDALGIKGSYGLLNTPPAEFEARVEECVRAGYTGWNVTVPHKERMASLLDEMSSEVRATGACNTVRVEGGRLVGYNTDIAGFLMGLEEAGGVEAGVSAVVMGAGGSARAVVYALAGSGFGVTILARNEGQARGLADEMAGVGRVGWGRLEAGEMSAKMQGARLLVNCTPIGMWPEVEATPIPAGLEMHVGLLVYDLIYRPRPTRLLQEAAEAGCRAQDGLAMLIGQGAAAFEIWTGHEAPVGVMREACLRELEKR